MEKFVGKNKDWFDELLIIKAFEALYGSAYLHQFLIKTNQKSFQK